jgi:hypothetical protein
VLLAQNFKFDAQHIFAWHLHLRVHLQSSVWAFADVSGDQSPICFT